MCGICGVLDPTARSIDREKIEKMISVLRHRGPDHEGIFVRDSVALANSRLAIQDISDAGNQPMQTEDGRYTLVYNGEIYNFHELREELERYGEKFQSYTDTEVALRAFRVWGIEAFPRFNGMFGIAIWDRDARTLYLARDDFGIKPLYYSYSGGMLVFGSEIKAILASGLVPSRMHWQGLHEYLHYSTTLGKNTFYRDIEKVLPGCVGVFKNEKVNWVKFSRITDSHQSRDSFHMATHKVYSYMDAAVRRHSISDVDIGVFLSGGIDSTTITALASRAQAKTLKTYAVGFDFPNAANELPAAKAVAELYGTEHNELFIQSGAIWPVLEELTKAHDQPFGDAANVPLYLLARELNGNPRVILQGDGGDEIFGGYRRYRRMRYYALLRMLSYGLKLGKHLVPKSSKAYRSLRAIRAFAEPDTRQIIARLMSQEQIDYQPWRVFSRSWRAKLVDTDPFNRYMQIGNQLSDLDKVQKMLFTDASIILPDLYFEKVDRATMAFSTEVRVPMVDGDLARYVMSLPSDYKVSHKQLKRILRAAMRDIVPDFILDAPKQGFGVPYREWVAGELQVGMRELLLDTTTDMKSVFDTVEISRCIDTHISGEEDHGFLLYKLLNFALWKNMYTPTVEE